MYRLSYTEEAKSQIQKQTQKIRHQFKTAIERIAQNPNAGKKLTHELSGFWSYRSGNYRIIYQVFHKEVHILIVTVGDRKNVYEKLARES